jgi:hypothetical protein
MAERGRIQNIVLVTFSPCKKKIKIKDLISRTPTVPNGHDFLYFSKNQQSLASIFVELVDIRILFQIDIKRNRSSETPEYGDDGYR